MASRMEAYKVKRKDNLADPEFWNRRFADMDSRMNAREQDATRIDNAVDEVEAVALQRLADTFTPLIVEAQTRLNNLGASFSAESLEEHTIGTGETTFTLTEASAENYVYTDYVLARSSSSPDNSMLGQVVSFNRGTRVLTVNVVSVTGSGTFSDWLIRVGTPPETGHAERTDNPHETTAAQVGAYTIAETAAAIAAAIAAIPSVSLAGLLTAANNLSDLSNVASARTNLGLKLMATQDTVGIGQIAASVFATIANIRAAAADKVIQADDLFGAAAYVALTDAATIAWDANAGFNFYVTLGGNRVLGFPTNPKVGQSGFIDVTEPVGGGYTLGFASGFTFDQGVVPTLDNAGSRTTSYYYHIRSATEVRIAVGFKGVR